MIHITLPDGRWLDLRPLVQDDDELFEMAWGSIDELCTLAGFTKFAAIIERYCAKRSAGLDDLTAMTAQALLGIVSEWATRSTPPPIPYPTTGAIH